MKKHIKIVVIAVILFCGIKSSAQTNINFTGKWLFNSKKSVFGNASANSEMDELTIRQTSDSISLTGKKGEQTAYALNGTPVSRKVQDSVILVGSYQKSEGGALLKKQTYFSLQQRALATVEEEWHLSPDQKELIISRTVKANEPDQPVTTVKAVYDKQW